MLAIGLLDFTLDGTFFKLAKELATLSLINIRLSCTFLDGTFFLVVFKITEFNLDAILATRKKYETLKQ